MKRVFLSGLMLLAACGTPQEQCISRNTQDLRTVESLIAQTETNLSRGYGVEKKTVILPTVRPCWRPGRPTKKDPNPAPVMRYCDADVAHSYNKPVTLDLDAEAVKLQQLRKKRAELTVRAQSVVSQCRALHPE